MIENVVFPYNAALQTLMQHSLPKLISQATGNKCRAEKPNMSCTRLILFPIQVERREENPPASYDQKAGSIKRNKKIEISTTLLQHATKTKTKTRLKNLNKKQNRQGTRTATSRATRLNLHRAAATQPSPINMASPCATLGRDAS